MNINKITHPKKIINADLKNKTTIAQKNDLGTNIWRCAICSTAFHRPLSHVTKIKGEPCCSTSCAGDLRSIKNADTRSFPFHRTAAHSKAVKKLNSKARVCHNCKTKKGPWRTTNITVLNNRADTSQSKTWCASCHGKYICSPASEENRRILGSARKKPGPTEKMDKKTLKMIITAMAAPKSVTREIAKRFEIHTTTLYKYINGDGSLKAMGKNLLKTNHNH